MDIYAQALAKIHAELEIADSLPSDRGELSAEAIAKIESLAERFGFTTETVIEAVLTNLVAYRVIVGRNPSKMDYYEDALKEYLEALPCVKAVQKLPKGGKNSLHVKAGKIVSNAEKLPHLKSLDLKVEFKNGQIAYVIHKHTTGSGGAQKSAYRDAMLTLEEGLGANGQRLLNLIAVFDGDYYQMKSRAGLNKIQESKAQHPEALICSYSDFEKETKPIWA